MDHIEFEKLLGKHVSIFEETIGNDFENKLFRKHSFYSIKDEFVKKYFFGLNYNTIAIQTDENEIIESISIHFRKVIDRQFFDLFVEKYGEPDHTYIISNIKVVSETTPHESNDPFHQNLTKREGDLIEGTFDEKPLFMIWEKDNFYIQAFLRHKQNISEITFSIDSPPFNVKPSNKN
ncbi:hypothetical protein [Aquimarina megaterium]|uniref:hypothetical protein n=1 Tax=Aquimarina megaterium TaxID=1443666 RepID=UPI0011118BE0|nr:hypothetical protein [Aquimarina megaterium]